jgi:hypothetical protein
MVSGQRVSSMRRAQRVPQSASSMRTRSSSGVPSHLSPPPYAAQPYMRHGMASHIASAELPRGKVQRRPVVEAASGEAERRRAKVAWGCSGVGRCRRGSVQLPLPAETSFSPRSSIPYSIVCVRNPSHVASSSSSSTTLRTV